MGPGWIVHSESRSTPNRRSDRLVAAPTTAQRDFYVRTHGTIPRLDGATHRLRVGGAVATPLDLTVSELLQRFPRHRVVAVMQCAGNRRADLQRVRPTSGDPWAGGAIGNAEWSGVALADVLRAAGAETGASWHVAFDCCDEVEMPKEGRFRFGVSIPMSKAMSPEVLLAVEMNGQALAPEHGFPLRVVTPGFAGVRSPKWLAGITVQDRPSANHMQQRDYKMLPGRHVRGDRRLDARRRDQRHAAQCRDLRAGGRRDVASRADHAARLRRRHRPDGGAGGGVGRWRPVLVGSDAAARRGTLELDLVARHHPLPPGRHELAVRAWDSAGQTQPALPDQAWNFKGYLSAAWHRVTVSQT